MEKRENDELDPQRRADCYIKTIGSMEHVSQSSSDKPWYVLGRAVPKSQLVFASQVLLIYIVVITSVVNLSLSPDDSTSKLWIILLSSCLGYILPNPTLKKNYGTN